MVHKKYIKKNGKIYGPYYYKSKRVGDKVVSEYVGENKAKSKSKKISRKSLVIGASIILGLVFIMLVLLLINSGILTGKSVSNPEKNPQKSIITGNAINNEILEEPSLSTGEFSQSIRNFKNWIIVTFRKGENIGEYSYSNSLSQEELDILIERDKIAWLEKISS